jgi:hypothetical protein
LIDPGIDWLKWLLRAALLAGAGYVLWRIIRDLTCPQNQPQPQPTQQPSPQPTATPEPDYIYREVDARYINRPEVAVALRRPADYVTGLSFWDDSSCIPQERQGIFYRFRVDTLQNSNYTVRKDGGNQVTALPGISINDILDLATEEQVETANRMLSGTFPPLAPVTFI